MVLLHILTEITDMNDDFTELQMFQARKPKPTSRTRLNIALKISISTLQ